MSSALTLESNNECNEYIKSILNLSTVEEVEGLLEFNVFVNHFHPVNPLQYMHKIEMFSGSFTPEQFSILLLKLKDKIYKAYSWFLKLSDLEKSLFDLISYLKLNDQVIWPKCYQCNKSTKYAVTNSHMKYAHCSYFNRPYCLSCWYPSDCTVTTFLGDSISHSVLINNVYQPIDEVKMAIISKLKP